MAHRLPVRLERLLAIAGDVGHVAQPQVDPGAVKGPAGAEAQGGFELLLCLAVLPEAEEAPPETGVAHPLELPRTGAKEAAQLADRLLQAFGVG